MIATVLALLGALANLLSFIAQNPGIPEDTRVRAIALAIDAITVASQTVERETLSRQGDREEFRILSKPAYDLYSLERNIHALINEERARLNLHKLILDDDLSSIARRHSEDQAATNRLTTDPQKPCSYPMIRHEGLSAAGFDLAERLDNAGVRFRRAAENIALIPSSKNFIYSSVRPVTCPTLVIKEAARNDPQELKRRIIEENIAKAQTLLSTVPRVTWINREWHDLETLSRRAVTGWLESAGHHTNIVNENYFETGIGAAEAGNYLVITQIFLEPVWRR